MDALQGIATLYLKLFLITGILFGLGMALIACLFGLSFTGSMSDTLILGITTGVTSGLAFGLLMSLILGTMHILAIKLRHYPITDETLKVDQTREIAMEVPYDEAFELCISSLKAIKGSRIISEDKEAGKIEAHTSMNWRSWGEKISFEVYKRAEGGSKIRVSSRPTIPATIVDYGKDLINVEKIAGRLKGQMA